jgi:hypothetical protein
LGDHHSCESGYPRPGRLSEHRSQEEERERREEKANVSVANQPEHHGELSAEQEEHVPPEEVDEQEVLAEPVRRNHEHAHARDRPPASVSEDLEADRGGDHVVEKAVDEHQVSPRVRVVGGQLGGG